MTTAYPQRPVVNAVPTEVNTAVYTPTSHVSWGSIIAGLFSAVTVLISLAVLGIALGLSSVDPNAPAGSVGAGIGIWGIVSALIAFAVGGAVAGHTAALPGRGKGALNGLLVWIVAIPLLLYLLSSGVGSILGTVTSFATTAIQAAAPIAAAAIPAAATTAQNPTAQAAAATAAATGVSAAAAVGTQVQTAVASVDPAQVKQAAGNVAWGTLLWLGLGFLAATLGGAFAARSEDRISVAGTGATVRS